MKKFEDDPMALIFCRKFESWRVRALRIFFVHDILILILRIVSINGVGTTDLYPSKIIFKIPGDSENS